jgi:hypothetical protein
MAAVGTGCAGDSSFEAGDSRQEALIPEAPEMAVELAETAAATTVSYVPAQQAQVSLEDLAVGSLADGAGGEGPIAINAIGDTLPGTDPEDFAEAAEAFEEEENINDGLGPIFNAEGCGTCHSVPVLGGSGAQIERRFGRITNGVFFGYDKAPENHGGTLRQLFSVGTYVNGSTTCTIPVEVEPGSTNVKNVGRRTTALFGLGLMDAMPDAVFPQVQATQPASLRGIARLQTILLPDPRDSSQRVGSQRVGRFGWKGGVPNLMQFSGDAYLNEMGITTQSCFQGTSVLAFAFENFPNNVAPPPGCNGGDLVPANPANDPAVPQFTDDPVGSCAGGRTEIQDDLILFTTFMESLAPPPRDLSDQEGVIFGSQVYDAVGCGGCHVTGTYITPFNPFNGTPSRFQFRPFSDFMLHDMGSLGDRIANTGDATVRTRQMRTSPLWGARFQSSFLHDGRATTIRQAILAHDGQAKQVRDNFAFGISPANQDLLIRYVNSL